MSISPGNPLADSLRDLAWSQWTELGVTGPFRRHDQVLLDPEALVAFTAALGDLDPRLRDESIDWCVHFGDAISVSRLKNLLQDGIGTRQVFDHYARAVNAASRLRWPTADAGATEGPDKPQLSGKSRQADLHRPALLRLRLRAIFGVGTRADVVAELLYATEKTAAELASIGYSKRQVASTLDDFTRAGLLRRRKEGNSYRFELTNPADLEPLVGSPPIYYAHWADCFRALLALAELLDERTGDSERLRLLAAQRVLSGVVSSLEKLRWGAPVSIAPKPLWPEIVRWSIERAQQAAHGAPDPRNVSPTAIF